MHSYITTPLVNQKNVNKKPTPLVDQNISIKPSFAAAELDVIINNKLVSSDFYCLPIQLNMTHV